MKKDDWVVFLEEGYHKTKVWSTPVQLISNPVMGWKTNGFSKFFISAEAFPQANKDFGKPSLFFEDPRIPRELKALYGEQRWIPADNVRLAKKSDFDPLIEHSIKQQKQATKDKNRFLAARRRVKAA